MNLVWYIVAIGMQRLYLGTNPLHSLLGYSSYARGSNRWLESMGLPAQYRSALIFLLPPLAILLLLVFTFGALHFLVSLTLVIYAVEPGRLDERLYMARVTDTEAPRRSEVMHNLAKDEYGSLHRYLFWLLAAGPAGMVLVRLLDQHRQWEKSPYGKAGEESEEEDEDNDEQEDQEEQGTEDSLAAKALYLADWLSGRVAACLLALVSGSSAFVVFRGLLVEKDKSGQEVFVGTLLDRGDEQASTRAVERSLNLLLLLWTFVFLITVILLYGPLLGAFRFMIP